jgi:ADP-ribose pyrophosphatase YjhB (NUDIX family)
MQTIIKVTYKISRMLWLLLKSYSVGVRLIMVRDGQVLLVKHVYENEWFIPGGLVECGEHLEQAARREAAEEVGATIRHLELFGVYTNLEYGRSDHIIVFLTEDFSLNGESDEEIEQTGFFPLNALPKDVSQGSENRIKEYQQGLKSICSLW